MATKETKVEEKAAVIEKKADDLVEIKLFKDNDKYKDDVFVSVNNWTGVIKRGVKVKVPRVVAEVLEQQEEQDYKTSLLIERYEKEAEDMEKIL